MRLYKVIGGRHGMWVNGKHFVARAGDVVELNDRRAETLVRSGSVVLADRDESPSELEERQALAGIVADSGDDARVVEGAIAEAEEVDWKTRLATTNASDVVREIRVMTDAGDLANLLNVERIGRRRSSVISAAEERINEIGSGEEEA